MVKEERPQLRFVRTRTRVDDEDIEAMKREFIPDSSCPVFPEVDGKTEILCQISEESFPGVLSRMTVEDAGEWAKAKCRHENWELEPGNIRSCLNNLEMDLP